MSGIPDFFKITFFQLQIYVIYDIFAQKNCNIKLSSLYRATIITDPAQT